ncbi:ATP-binding protein [Paenibacillus sp. FSL R10-2734]|uniref:ATP-binding protein n=1 Tax=Paenibacillus sp. FSL R10-2734 TaxID=2954691 RepID=UPI0030DC1772
MVRTLHIAITLSLLLIGYGSIIVSAANQTPSQEITKWQMKWGAETGNKEIPWSEGQQSWINVDSMNGLPELPSDVSAAWTRISLPNFKYVSPSVYIDTLYALHVKVYVEDRLIFEEDRKYIKDNYSLLLPLSKEDNGKTLYIWTATMQDRIGIKDSVVIGEHSQLINDYIGNGLSDVILGCAFFLVAIVLFISALYINKDYFSSVASLAVVIASTGILSITYSPFIYTFYNKLGPISIVCLDLALFSLLPALTFLFEKLFGSGKFGIIRKFRQFQVLYSSFCLLCLFINLLSNNRYIEFYYFVSTTIIGVVFILQFILLIACVIMFSLKGNKDAIVFAIGFGVAAFTVVAELLWYYIHKGNYDLFLWKWGLVAFIISLIVILERRLAYSHQQVLNYSRELERFNNELERSEKMEIISELAASVAHEVRNPLQVTRGFLQLLSEKSVSEEQIYMSMALSELDRASNIITDFLTFAKPEFETVSSLNLYDEFKHIESIMQPLCHINGGKMILDVSGQLWVKGNSSKFKQAFINIIKNSIESFNEEGFIYMSVYGEDDKVIIHIKDNGEGMDADVLHRLGEPYFTKKNKGTGLGLMVTFRIIESMQGEVRFTSKKGVGTESITILPLAEAPDDSYSL